MISHALDGNMVRESIAMAFKAGHERHIPLIIGTNEDETVRLPEVARRSNIDLNIDSALANETMDLLKQLYPGAGSDQRRLAAKRFTDRNFVEPARLIARAHSSRNAPTYRYAISNHGIFATRDPWTARLDRLERQSESR